LRITEEIGEVALVVIPSKPRPASAGHTCRLEILLPVLDAAEVFDDTISERAAWIAAAAKNIKVELVIQESAVGKRVIGF